MLYVTTRDNRDPCTPYRTLHSMRSSDGGFYLPFRHPGFTPEEIEALTEMSFGESVAQVLNRLFNTRLTGWDIDSCCGRKPVRLCPLNQRILIAEGWHNPEERFSFIIESIARKLCPDIAEASEWVHIAVRASVLFGLFTQLQKTGISQADIAMVSGDFTLPISAWYARHWGLPIGNIVCCCNENNSFWELLCHGQMRTDTVAVSTRIPEADIAVPAKLERLIYEAGGQEAVAGYLDCVRTGSVYHPGDSLLSQIRKGMYASVVSSLRLNNTIPSVYRTHSYLMTPSTALAYAGSMDYRAKTGQTRPILIWAEESPSVHATVIGQIMASPEPDPE